TDRFPQPTDLQLRHDEISPMVLGSPSRPHEDEARPYTDFVKARLDLASSVRRLKAFEHREMLDVPGSKFDA
ncbi:MAG: hypothetical protein ACTHKT_01800, partial [Solirubrobacterales bacterium]